MSNRRLRVMNRIGFGLCAVGTIFISGCEPPAVTQRRALSLAEALSPGDTTGFFRAEAPIDLEFPRDHGPHTGFQTEWWYLVGNLQAGERRLGYQATFFRSALRPESGTMPVAASSWATNDVYMAHFALTDIDNDRFYAFERFSRGALGLAGARAEPFRVWLDDWSLEGEGASTLPLRLRAAEEEIEIDLRLDSARQPVLQGDRGLSRKGRNPGNASYYYSFTRLQTDGTVRVGERQMRVTGDSWMDREWSTSAIEEGQVGWDWFALHLADGRDLMLYRLRRQGDRTDAASSGVVVERDGSYRVLGADDFDLQVLDRWRSRDTGIEYPSSWRLTSAAAGIDLTVEPVIEAQEHTASVIYWEGAVDAAGVSRGERVFGRGYMELTGYARTDGEPRSLLGSLSRVDHPIENGPSE